MGALEADAGDQFARRRLAIAAALAANLALLAAPPLIGLLAIVGLLS